MENYTNCAILTLQESPGAFIDHVADFCISGVPGLRLRVVMISHIANMTVITAATGTTQKIPGHVPPYLIYWLKYRFYTQNPPSTLIT